MAAIVNLIIGGVVHIIIKLIYVAVAFVWSTYCKLACMPEELIKFDGRR